MATNKNSWKKEGKHVGVLRMKCTTVAAEARRYDVKVVDYFSLDVEGHELKVLEGVDFENIRFNVITVEAKGDFALPIEELLAKHGYLRHVPTLDDTSRKHARLSEDVVFVHEDVVWGKPV